MFGYSTPEEMLVSINDIGKQIYVYPEDRERIVRLLNENDFVKDFETRVYKKDGSTFWISINARLIRDEKGQLDRYEGTNIDITERKIADEMLAQKKQKLLESNQQLESVNRELLASYGKRTAS